MKKVHLVQLLGIQLLLLFGCSSNKKQHRAVVDQEPPKRIEILFLGHDSEHHNSEKYVPMLAMPLFQKGINLTYTEDTQDLNPENLARYDGLMIYANQVNLTPGEEAAMKSFLEGGKGLIPIHSASFMFQNSDWYISTVGAQFKSHGTGDFVAEIVKSDHPVMQGLVPFSTWDETYVHHKINPDMEVLMERVENGHREPWTWVRKQGEGRIFYTAYGHDERTWGNPGFHKLLANGVLWAVSEGAKARLSNLNVPIPTFEDAEIPNYEQRDPAPRFQHPLSPEESQKLVQVPVDFELQLFASEPDIINPIAMAWDEKGRLFVIETVDYPNEIRDSEGKGNDRIKILEDTDGDGKADKVTVFAEGLNIPTSLTFANGGLIVSMAPHFLFLKDTDGDDKADIKEKIISGWGKSDTHAGPSNLKYGLDNKVWGVLGYSGFKGTVSGKDLSFGQGVYRFDPDGENLEYLGRTSNNTWGLGFSEDFDVFISTANGMHSAYLAMTNEYVKRPIIGGSGNTVHRVDTHYDMPHVTPYLRQVDWHGGYTSAAGHNLYTARDYPSNYWNRIGFVAEPTGRVLHNVELQQKGAGYTEKNGFNLLASSDEWFSPVHAEVGPDGAVWVADWYNFIIQHNPTPRGFENGEGNAYINPLRDSAHGRIYRVVYKKAAPYVPMQLNRDDSQGLVEALSNDNMFWRTTAQRLIVESGNKAIVPALYPLINDRGSDSIGLNAPAVHALWTLHGLGALDGTNKEAIEVVTQALSHPVAGVRKNAIRVLPKNGETLTALIAAGVVNDPDLKTRMAAILAIADIPGSPVAGKLLYEASGNPENASDEYLPQAIFAAALTYGDSYLEAAPKERNITKADSLLTLTERVLKSMDEEKYVIDRWTPIMFPPDAANKEISVEVSMGTSEEGLQGMVLAQGDATEGYSMFVRDSRIHWVIKRQGKTYAAISKEPLPADRFNVVATLSQGGEMEVAINGETVAQAKAPGLFSKTFKTQKVRIAREDDATKVGDHPDDFEFVGYLGRDGNLNLKKPSAVEVKKMVEKPTPKKKSPAPVKAAPKVKSVTINLKVVEHEMKFDKKTFSVKAGQQVTLQFSNPDFMQHNFLLLQPGSLEKVGTAADALARDPKGAEQNYVPKMKEVIIATKLVDPEGRETLVFKAPGKPGKYPFVCTVPGHWRLMNGIMIVESP
tara:strand:- start:49284 stop:52829 length:3546 start_codon:yes stop_codon:yes gene_type:complete